MTHQTGRCFEVGVIGAGWISSAYQLPILDSLEETTIGFIADIDGQKSNELAKNYGTKAVEIKDDPSSLPTCDIVFLGVPVGVREEYIDEFSSRNTPIFSEKPFAIDKEDHYNYLEKSENIACNYMRTCYSATRQLEAIVDSGVFGELLHIEMFDEGKVWGTGYGKDHWQTDVNLSGGGVLMEHGCHSLSQLLQIFPDYTIEIGETEIIWNGDLDSDVKTTLYLSKGGHEIEVEYRVSRIKPIEQPSRFVFDNAVITGVVTKPESTLTISPRNESMMEDINCKPSNEWARTIPQAMYLRWKQFLRQITQDIGENHYIRTAPEVTETITEIYNHG